MQSCLPAAPHTLYRVHCELGCVESGITARSSTAIMNCRDTLPGTYFITPLSLRQARKKQLQGCTGCSFALEKAPSFMWEVSNLRPSPLPNGPPPRHICGTATSTRHRLLAPPLAATARHARHRCNSPPNSLRSLQHHHSLGRWLTVQSSECILYCPRCARHASHRVTFHLIQDEAAHADLPPTRCDG